MKKLIALFSAAVFSFALGTAFAEEESTDPLTAVPKKSFADMKKEKDAKKGVKKPAEKKKTPPKKASGKKKNEKTGK